MSFRIVESAGIASRVSSRCAGLVLAIIIGCVSGTAEAVPLISVSPSAPTVAVGHEITVDVLIADAADLYAYQLGLAFDAALFNVVDVIEGSFLASGGSTIFFPGADNGAGVIEFNAGTLVGAVP